MPKHKLTFYRTADDGQNNVYVFVRDDKTEIRLSPNADGETWEVQ